MAFRKEDNSFELLSDVRDLSKVTLFKSLILWKNFRRIILWNKTDCGNYRPISVISVVAKLFEGLVYNQLRTFISDNNILIVEQQSGFRSQHSTETARLGSTNEWLYNMDSGLINGVLFLDLKKAFDTVDHEI